MVRPSSFIIKSGSELGIKAGRSRSACRMLSPIISCQHHCRQPPPFFPVITGSGVPHQAWPSPEGFKVRNPITHHHVRHFSATLSSTCCSRAGLWLPELRCNNTVRVVSLFRSSFNLQIIISLLFRKCVWFSVHVQ